ncbi:hypothetical protein DERF_002887 [Dermatophagoides farinae]|uniref:Uncharacterized protein n=1 Tax=Dermatophagoides farinae TaxID=6954 RepID=A0A922ICH0_DERFA|nr:hypothetical protein DERF_002887 [Dermatophagoides farinae]
MFRLDNRCSIYQAELLAVVEAINWVCDNNVLAMVQHIFQKKSSILMDIFVSNGLKAHNGNFGKQLADYLAKRAVESRFELRSFACILFKYESQKKTILCLE